MSKKFREIGGSALFHDGFMATVTYQHDWQKFDRLRLLLAKINAGTAANSEGSVTFTDYDHQQYFDLLPSAFRYPTEIPRSEFGSIVYRSSIDLRKRGRITAENLLHEVNERAAQNLSRPLRRFTMWTRLRLRNMGGQPGFRLRYDDVRIEGTCRLPVHLRLDSYFLSGHGEVDPNLDHSFGYLIVRTTARSEDAAARKFFDACDAFYSLTNIYWRTYPVWADRHSEAKLWMWRFNFFWQGQKYLKAEKVWYDPAFDAGEWNRFPGEYSKFLEALPSIRGALAKLQSHPLRSILFQAAKLIHEGMASPDLSFRLLRYWSAMERLYSESENKNAPYDKLIRRLTFAENDRELAIMKLERLSTLRNAYVHSGSTEDDRNMLTQFLGRVLEHQIRYVLVQGTDFADHGELIEMADLPGDLDILERRKRSIQRRQNIIRFGRHKE